MRSLGATHALGQVSSRAFELALESRRSQWLLRDDLPHRSSSEVARGALPEDELQLLYALAAYRVAMVTLLPAAGMQSLVGRSLIDSASLQLRSWTTDAMPKLSCAAAVSPGWKAICLSTSGLLER